MYAISDTDIRLDLFKSDSFHILDILKSELEDKVGPFEIVYESELDLTTRTTLLMKHMFISGVVFNEQIYPPIA